MLRLGLRFSQRHGLRHAFSHRVNDVNDSFEPWALSLWKRTHPQFLLARPGDSSDPNTTRYWWSALDFERPAVREYLYRILAGICLGFLPHNYHPARIFMGDTGAMLIGLLLAYVPISSLANLDPVSLTIREGRLIYDSRPVAAR